MRFCTAVSCMDGRIQLPVIMHLRKRFNAEFVDTITEAGPNLIIAEQRDQGTLESIHRRLKISIENHQSVGIAIVGHHDCAGNPVSKEKQIAHIVKAVEYLRNHYNEITVIGLWVCDRWYVEELC